MGSTSRSPTSRPTRRSQQAFTIPIGSSLSNFPLSSTVSGLTFDFSTGAPVATTASLGPIFAERAQTIGPAAGERRRQCLDHHL